MFFDNFFKESWMFFYKFLLHLLRINEKHILESEEMAEMISMIKSLKGVKVGEKLGFFKALLAGTTSIRWRDIIEESYKETINEKYVKELLATYDTETLRFKGKSGIGS